MNTCESCGHKLKPVKIGKFLAKFVKITPGTFMMGSPLDEPGRFNDEIQHEVTLTEGFEMQTTPVTQAQYEAVMGSNPSRFDGINNPVEMVSWDDAQEFIKRLNASQKLYAYRLPTEAEWEYCARAGTTTPYYFKAEQIDSFAWHFGNSDNKTHPVGQKHPNACGLYDMSGNVCEWVEDWYGAYPGGPVIDPIGPSTGSYRVIRGGSWNLNARYLRASFRLNFDPGNPWYNVSFRLVRSKR